MGYTPNNCITMNITSQSQCMCRATAANVHFAFNRATRLYHLLGAQDPTSPYTWYALHRDDSSNMCAFIQHYYTSDLPERDFEYLETRWKAFTVEGAPKPASKSRKEASQKKADLFHVIRRFMSIDVSDNEIELDPIVPSESRREQIVPQVIPDVHEAPLVEAIVDTTPQPESKEVAPLEIALRCTEELPLCQAMKLLDLCEERQSKLPTASNRAIAPDPGPIFVTASTSKEREVQYYQSVLRHSDVIYQSGTTHYHKWYGLDNVVKKYNTTYVVNEPQHLVHCRKALVFYERKEDVEHIHGPRVYYIRTPNPIDKVLNEVCFKEIYWKTDPLEVLRYLRSVVGYGAIVSRRLI